MVEIRPLLPSDLPAVAAIHVEGWRTAYARFIPTSILDELSCERTVQEFEPWIFHSTPAPIGYVAQTAGSISGFVLAGPNEGEPAGYDAEIYKLFVRPDAQRRRIGLRLLHTAVTALRAQGHQRVAVWTFREGESVHYYERLGGQLVQQTALKLGDCELAVNIYGWPLGPLAELLAVRLDPLADPGSIRRSRD